jgi:NitT/TauT family transport system substrate-binding protein
MKDLKGKAIAFPKGLASHFFLLKLLKDNGLTPSDIKAQYMEAGDAASAFIANKVDAAVTWEPFLSEAGKTKNSKILITSKEYPGIITDNFLVGSNVAKQRGDDVEKLLKGWFKALDYIKTNESDAMKIMKDKFGLETNDLVGMMSGLRFAYLDDNIKAFDTSKGVSDMVATFNIAGQIYNEVGIISKPVQGEKYFDSSFLVTISKKELVCLTGEQLLIL